MPSAGDAWAENLLAAIGDGPERRMATALASAAPASYRERTTPEHAALDAAELVVLASQQPTSDHGRFRFAVRPVGGGRFHVRRFADRPVELTALMPVLESFGLVVEESVPSRVELGREQVAYVDDIGVRLPPPAGPAPDRPASTPSFDPAAGSPRLVDALGAVVVGRADVDRLNTLVTSADLTWREVVVLRAYTRFWSQCPSPVTADDLEDALLAFPGVARALVGYFIARFDPEGAGGEAEAAARAVCTAELGLVPHLRSDRALRVYLQLIDATLRTSYFRVSGDGTTPPVVVLKLDSLSIPGLPAPAPRVEAWVHGAAVEGVHLRAGLVARGGLRWSERPADFRTEVLDLMVAQVKKNAIIVPTGAKGGFVCRKTPFPGPADVRAAYATFVRALLDITDNLVGGEVVVPERVVARDGADPYLVVAADRGTADLSDLANEISAEHAFWLGDAFASGGSHGYNHKAMGITARGAWMAVRRHFHQLGIDVQREPIRVAGIGDMSGDVFGNGMLSSDAVRLVAAFDHRHVFLDPDPDPVASFQERRRLASLARSSWADYDRALISPGGGVWSRDVKTVPLSPEARRALGVDREQLTPPALVSAILEAPVDLLWFGGIGTFVKDAAESDADVGDHANDEVRVTADRVRARVIAEGGNLGATQRARIRYSRRGGRINGDFIDNAAGVATSDREVNLKILLKLASEAGRLEVGERDAYLARAEHDVASAVLRQVDRSVAALNRGVPESAEQLDAYAALIETLEASGRVDRVVEALPTPEELAVRRGAGAGLIRPELAVLLAYAKSDLASAVELAPLVRHPSLAEVVERYFPDAVHGFADLVPNHRLYGQILATEIAGEIVDEVGIAWAHETAAELGRNLADVSACFWAARQVTRAAQVWAELDDAWSRLPADADNRLHQLVARAVADVARAYLVRGGPVDPPALVEEDARVADALADASSARTGPDGGLGPDGAGGFGTDGAGGQVVSESPWGWGGPSGEAGVKELVASGVGEELARRVVSVCARARVRDVGPVVRATGCPPAEVAAALDRLDEAAATGRMEAALRRSLIADRWRSWLVRALLDDIADWRRRAAVSALGDTAGAGGGAGAGAELGAAVAPGAASTGWVKLREPQLARVRSLLRTLDEGADAPTVVAVALRRLPGWSTSGSALAAPGS